MRDELTFNASDNDVAPESPKKLQMECDWMIINGSYSKKSVRSSRIRDELTFNDSDIDAAPESPILL